MLVRRIIFKSEKNSFLVRRSIIIILIPLILTVMVIDQPECVGRHTSAMILLTVDH